MNVLDILLLVSLLGILTWPWVFCFIGWQNAVRGSHRRYVMATLTRGMFPPLIIANVADLIISTVNYYPVGRVLFTSQDPIDSILAVFNLGITIIAYVIFDKDDDDDWFKKTGKRVRGWFKARARVRQAGWQGA